VNPWKCNFTACPTGSKSAAPETAALREADGQFAALARRALVMIPLAAPNLPATDFAAAKAGLGGVMIGPTGGPAAAIDQLDRAVARCRAVSALPDFCKPNSSS